LSGSLWFPLVGGYGLCNVEPMCSGGPTPHRPVVLLPTDAMRAFTELLTEVCYTPPVRSGKHEAWIRLQESRKGVSRENISTKTTET